MDENDVNGAVLIQHGGTYDNEYLLNAAAAHAGRFKVVAMIDPDDTDPTGTLERLAGQGAAGIRLSPSARVRGPDPLALWKKAGELGMTISSLGSAVEFASTEFKRLLDSCPHTSLVIEHLAGWE